MLPVAPSGRTNIKIPAHLRLHATALTTLVVAVALAACFHFTAVRSIAPAIDRAAAIDVPEFVGRWAAPGDTRWDVRRVGDSAGTYAIGASNLAATNAAEPPVLRYEGRIGRAGDVMLLEIHAAVDASDSAAPAARAHASVLEPMYVVYRFDLDGNRLRLTPFAPDSLEAAVRDGRCATPYFADAYDTFLLTGSSPQVRAAWGCAAMRPGFMGEPILFQRETIPTAIARSH